MYIDLTSLSNGIKFDLTSFDGAGVQSPLYVFRPNLFHTITRVEVFNDKMQYVTIEGRDYIFSCDGSYGAKMKVDGVEYATNVELFNEFITRL